MHVPYNSRLPSIILVALFALAPCWAAPAKGGQNTTPPNTSPQHPSTQNTPPPQTPANPVAAGGQMEIPSRPRKARLERTTVTRFLADWTHKAGKDDQLRGIAASTGGTEAWVQYEFEYFLKKKLEIPVEQKIRMREQRPYLDGDQRADWIIKPDISLSVGDTKGLVIELKVESEAEKETASARAKRIARLVQEDISKVSAGFNAEFADYASAVIAITFNSETHQALEKLNMDVVDGQKSITLADGRQVKIWAWHPRSAKTDTPADTPSKKPT